MSKERHYYKERGQAKSVCSTSSLDNHHLCFIRAWWGKGYVRELRQFHYCIMPIPKNTLHRFIHRNMSGVPVPKDYSAKQALEQLLMLEKANAIHDDDPIEKRLNLLVSLFDCIEQPTADGFRKQLELVRYYKNPP